MVFASSSISARYDSACFSWYEPLNKILSCSTVRPGKLTMESDVTPIHGLWTLFPLFAAASSPAVFGASCIRNIRSISVCLQPHPACVEHASKDRNHAKDRGSYPYGVPTRFHDQWPSLKVLQEPYDVSTRPHESPLSGFTRPVWCSYKIS